MAGKNPIVLYNGIYEEIQVGDVINPVYLSPCNVLQQAVINGNFAINQLVVSGTVTLAAGAYGHDMWKAGASGCIYTFATTANITTITITSGTLQQIIEGINLYTGTYALSWTGTSQGRINSGSYSASGITGAITGGTNATVEFGTGTLSKVNFNFGTIALPFQAKSFTEDRNACLRYFETSYDYGITPGSASSLGAVYSTSGATGVLQGFRFRVEKRTDALVTIYSPSGTKGDIWGSTDSNVGASISVGNPGTCGVRYLAGSNITTGYPYTFHYTSDARL
jgi:hypothetical protein